jgi:hypothetical protein
VAMSERQMATRLCNNLMENRFRSTGGMLK